LWGALFISGARQTDRLAYKQDAVVIAAQSERGRTNMNKEIPVACSHTVFTKEQRVEYKNIWEELETRKISITELEQGYQYQFQGDSETLRLVNEWVSMERKCCPFLTFTVIASNEEEPVFLKLTGSEEVKAFLRTDIQSNINMITRQE
jgi:hypothetical protein